MAYIPEERMRDGAIREFSVQENIFLHDHVAPRYTRGIFLSFPADGGARARSWSDEFAVKTPSLDTPIKNLSGGNIQKLIMARELSRQPAMLIAAQPTRGVDIGATEYIHQRLLEQREAGTAILLISEDLDEILRPLGPDRGDLRGTHCRGRGARPGHREQIGLMMAGVGMQEALQGRSDKGD